MRGARTLRRLVLDGAGSMRGHDVALYAAGLTFYGGIARLPTTLVALWLSRFLLGADRVERLGGDVARALPDAVGAPAFVGEPPGATGRPAASPGR